MFKSIQNKKPRRSSFDLSHERKFSMNMGDLVPILCEEVVPGDSFRMNTEVLMRLVPMIAPMMHRVNVYTHFFFVPNRLVWNEWENFITGGEDGQALPAFPTINVAGTNKQDYFFKGSLPDYLGVNTTETTKSGNFHVNALPFRAYQTIYNEYYRDQNLQEKVNVVKTSGVTSTNPNLINTVTLRKRCWEKDYFTSALPWTQKGGDVLLPNDVVLKEDSTSPGKLVTPITHTPNGTTTGLRHNSSGTLQDDGSIDLVYDPNGSLGSQTTIEELRRATKLQKWLERNARGGSRYIEQILSHFGVRSSDARLQRPEYLGGGKTPIVISEVLQTSSTDATSPQGEMAGHGIGVGNSHRFNKYFEEHGYVIGIISVLPRTTYMDGTRRHFFKEDKFDYYWPEFAQLGEQPVMKGELYTSFDPAADDETFGYQSRYAEYKYIPSTVHGEMKDTLKFWHMAREVGSDVALNGTFVTSDPTHRVFAVTDPTEHKLIVQVYNNLKAIRPMPYFNNPTL